MIGKLKTLRQLTETEKAYIAGLLDGEGCVGIYRKTSPNNLFPYNYGLRVIITNSNYEIIQWLKETTGIGCAYKYKKSPNENWNVVHRWQVTAEQARSFLRVIRPYSKIKADIIDLCMQIPTNSKGKSGRSVENFETQTKIFALAKARNHRGKAA